MFKYTNEALYSFKKSRNLNIGRLLISYLNITLNLKTLPVDIKLYILNMLDMKV